MNKSSQSNSWLLKTIREILNSDNDTIQDHGLHFANIKAAAKHNYSLLKQYGYDYAKLVADHPNSTITPGSEFRKPDILEKLFHKHVDWKFVKAKLADGDDYHINRDVVDEKSLRSDLLHMIERGNHKSTLTEDNKKEVQAVLKKEILRGWQFPIVVNTILKIPGAMYIPIGNIDQITVVEAVISDYSFDAHYTGHSFKKKMHPVLLLTQVESFLSSYPHNTAKSASQ